MELRKVLDGVESLEMVMPEFQREYVWPIEDAKQLIVSMFKGYPTGCLLFWETETPPEIKNKAIDTSRLGLTKVILDGQQRLTTLYMFIMGEIPPYYTKEDILNDPRHLYFNLMTGDFQFYQKSSMDKSYVWQNVTDCFDEKKIDAYDISEKYVAIDSTRDFKEVMKMINRNLSSLRAIEQMDYPILTVPKKAKIDEAIDVFDKVNSQGTKLTDAELVLTHITGRWPQARRVMKEKIQKLIKIGFSFDLDFLSRCMVVTLTDSALLDKNAKLKYDVFQKEDYIKAWEKVSKAIDYLIPILQQDALISSTNDFNTINVLVPLVAHLVKNENRFIGNLKFKFLHWMFLALIWQRYSGQTGQRLDKDVYTIYNSSDPISGLLNEIEDQRGRLEVKPSDLEGRGSGHPLYKMLYIITKSNKAIDWANGGAIYGTIGENYSIQSHHIFPKGYLNSNGFDSENHLDRKKVNEIANRAFITRDANYSISDTAPEKYLPKIEKEYPGAISKQFIPNDPEIWNATSYETFLDQRRTLIANEINSFLENLKQQRIDMEPVKAKEESPWKELIKKGENNFVEFKSSLRYCLREQKPMKYIEHAIAKTISAFLNSEGGTLFIGVDDAGEIQGIKNDFSTFGKKNSKDAFLLYFDQLIKNYLGNEFNADIRNQFIQVNEEEIFIVEVSASNKPVYLYADGKQEFFVRGSASSQPYSMREAVEYINKHWS
jgi:hypothetical protein